jgi:hypothetical protein
MSSETEQKLEAAQEKLERELDNQLQSLNGLSTNFTVLLGLVITGLGFIITLGHQLFVNNEIVGFLGLSSMLAAAALLLASMVFLDYFDAPSPSALLDAVANPKVGLSGIHQAVVASLASAFYENRAVVRRAYRLYIAAAVVLIVGLALLVIDVAV